MLRSVPLVEGSSVARIGCPGPSHADTSPDSSPGCSGFDQRISGQECANPSHHMPTASSLEYDKQETNMNRHNGPLTLAFLSLFASTWLPPSLGQEDHPVAAPEAATSATTSAEIGQFLRIRPGADGQPAALQTSLTRYRDSERGLLVDLVGVVHIGEAEYYQRLNRQLALYDVVLYELVAPEGMQVPGPERESNHPISWIQDSMRAMLGLESQLEKIEYNRDNFVHADLTPEEIGELMQARGDSALTLGLNALADVIREANRSATQNKPPAKSAGTDEEDFTELLEMAAHPVKLKRFMAEQFTTGDLEHGLGQSLNQLLIDDRNKAAIGELQRQIDRGQRHIAIFYGAAHMPDFAKRLERDFGMKRTRQVWVDAWDLSRAPDESLASGPAAILQQLLKAIDQ